MMNSSIDDDFAPNPFRSAGDSGNMMGQQQQQQQQQPQFAQPPVQQQPQFAQPPVATQQQFAQPPAPTPSFQQQQPAGATMAQPPVDTSFAQQMHQQQQFQQQQQPPTQPYIGGGLSGQMDTMNGGVTTPTSQQQQNQLQQPTSYWGSCMQCLTLDTYRAYFDIDTDDISNRMRSSVMDFYKPEYFRNEVIGVAKAGNLKGPDLYGPFWITMTLIFFIAVTSNVHAYLHRTDVEEFDYDINHLLHASWIIGMLAFGVPTILWITTKCMGMQSLLLVEWVCIYGYSLVPFIPIVLLCMIPFGLISWILLLVGTIMSGSLVVRNVAPPLLSADPSQAKSPPIIIAILGIHLIFMLYMKFSFYHHSKKK